MTVITVDRRIPGTYLRGMKVLLPELDALGLFSYDFAKIQLRLTKGQDTDSPITGDQVYQELQDTHVLELCLGLRDGEEIVKLGKRVFQKAFGEGTKILLFRSVVEIPPPKGEEKPQKLVPMIWDAKRDFGIHWTYLHLPFTQDYFTGLFPMNFPPSAEHLFP